MFSSGCGPGAKFDVMTFLDVQKHHPPALGDLALHLQVGSWLLCLGLEDRPQNLFAVVPDHDGPRLGTLLRRVGGPDPRVSPLHVDSVEVQFDFQVSSPRPKRG